MKLQRFFLAVFALALWITPAVAEEKSWQTLNSEVVALNEQGRYSQALPLAEESLKVAESTVESDHPFLTASLNNLGALYQALGKYEEAEIFYRQTLEIEERALGEDHPRVAITRNNLEELLKAKQRLAFARKGNDLPPTGGESLLQGPWARLDMRDSPPPGSDSAYAAFEEEVNPHRRLETELSFHNGFRFDDFRWNIAGNKSGNSPNILSELTWKKLQAYGVTGGGRMTLDRLFTVRGSYASARIYRGQNQDSDYTTDNRTGENSRSNNSSDTGSLVDTTLGAGYPWRLTSGGYDATVSFLGGYSYHEQNLTITNGYQTIPRTGYFSDLDSKYEARWRGPWGGVDLVFKQGRKFTLFSTFEYHWARYRADAHWNLRTDLAQPKSFRHTADGTGVVGSVGVSYLLTKRWSLYLNTKGQSWSTDPGVDKTFTSKGKTSETKLNEVVWQSYEVQLGAHCQF